jgi:hypothetical protein
VPDVQQLADATARALVELQRSVVKPPRKRPARRRVAAPRTPAPARGVTLH